MKGRARDLLGAMMAMTMHAIAMPFIVGHLFVVTLFDRFRSDGSNLVARFACDCIDSSTEHNPEQQQESCKAPSTSKGQAEEHYGAPNSFVFTISHPPIIHARRMVHAV